MDLDLRSTAAAAIAAGVIVHYVRQTQQNDAGHVDTIRYYERSQHMHLDQVTVRNLELLEPIFHDAGTDATLFKTLDCLMTPMGKRFLRASLLRPLLDTSAIEERYEAVGEAKKNLDGARAYPAKPERDSGPGAAAGAHFTG